MKSSTELSRGESGVAAVSATSLGPWKAALPVGAAVGAIDLGLTAVTGGGVHFAGPVSLGLLFFFGIGGLGAVLSGSGGDRRLRRWAAEHPWKVAVPPALGFFVTDVVLRQILSTEGLWHSVWNGIWMGAILTAIVGLAGAVAGGRKGDSY